MLACSPVPYVRWTGTVDRDPVRDANPIGMILRVGVTVIPDFDVRRPDEESERFVFSAFQHALRYL
jgi:hypothetical protein